MLNKKASNSIDFGLLNVTSNQIVSNNNMIYPTSISRDKGINEVINQALNSIETENKKTKYVLITPILQEQKMSFVLQKATVLHFL